MTVFHDAVAVIASHASGGPVVVTRDELESGPVGSRSTTGLADLLTDIRALPPALAPGTSIDTMRASLRSTAALAFVVGVPDGPYAAVLLREDIEAAKGGV